MEPLDLSTAPPRSPRAELASIVFLPRSIDKLRAALPGGQLGEYNIEGFTTMMFEQLGIAIADVSAIVASAASEDDVAAYVTKHARPGGADAWNAFALHRVIFNGDRAAAEEEIPWLRAHPEIVLALDMLAEDDRRSFAAAPH
jgi:hypothetical protein